MNQSKPSLKVLLIAIDKYPNWKHRLNGCNNDIQAFRTFLEAWTDSNTVQLNIVQLCDHQATYENVTTTFLSHFKDLKDGDTALVYYSGHGSRVPAPPVFWHSTAHEKHESLVLYDSRLENGKDLLDKELSWLIWKVSQDKNVNFSVVLDSCHSGSGTRLEEVLIRRTEGTGHVRPWTTYLGADDYQLVGDNVIVPRASHLLLSACQDFETAKEKRIGRTEYGVFSYSLLKALQQSNGRLSYQELAIRTQARVYEHSYEQHPQLEPIGGASIYQLFLGQTLTKKLPWTLVRWDKKMRWIVEAGTLHGVPLFDADTPTKWLVYPMDSSATTLKDSTKALAEVTATEVFATCSTIMGMKAANKAYPDDQYKAVLSAIVIPRLKVYLVPDSASIVQDSIEVEKNANPSLFLEWVEQKELADYYVLAKDQHLFVFKPEGTIPVFKPLAGYDEAVVNQLYRNLETIAKWHQIRALNHPNSYISEKDVSFEFYEVLEASPNYKAAIQQKRLPDFLTKEIVLRYQFNPHAFNPADQWEEPMFRLKVKNTAKHGQDLWLTVLFLGSDYGIDNSLLFNQKLAYGEEIWLEDMDDHTTLIPLHLEDAWQSWGINEIVEHFKIIVSTESLNPHDFKQPGLPLSHRVRDGYRTYLEKGKGRKSKKNDIDPTDWRTFDFSIKIVQPLEKYALKAASPTRLLDYGITITTPPLFEAQVRLRSSREVNRSYRNLANQPHLMEGVSAFSSPLGHSPGLDVLEFSSIKGEDKIDAAHPLKIEIEEGIAANERLVAYGYNEELGHFMPLGLSTSENRACVVIEQLPDPLGDDKRSFGRALKIFFYKTALEKIGIESEYPILAEVQVAENGEDITYIKDLDLLKTKVAEAKNILILVHGIIGNTKAMAKATQKASYLDNKKNIPIGKHYDLILTFDYENLKTPIEESAQLLKKKLETIGLTTAKDKTIHLLAHSMGGLLARWLIEKMEGDQFIDHLILIGTPNLGSTWAKVQHLAKWLLTFAFGKLALSEPVISVLAFLGSYAEQTQVTFEQMNPNSDFMKRLNDGTATPMPYTILVGNTSSISFQQKMKSANFFNKIGLILKHHVWYQFLDKTIFREANDIAVTVKSAFGVPASKQVKHVEVESDHLSYFWEGESLEELGNSIRQLWI